MCEYIILEGFIVDKYMYDESNGLWYELKDDYYIPCLTLPEEGGELIGIWGQRHRAYLKEYRKVTYTTILMEGKLDSYLSDTNEQAQERLETLVEQMKQAEGIAEQLKVENALKWAQKMNNIRHRAEEIVCSEITYI